MMSRRRRVREICFAVLYSLGAIFLFIAGIIGENIGALLMAMFFLLIAAASCIKLAVNSPSKPGKDRPIKQNAAQLARERELEELKAKEEAARREREAANPDSTVSLQIRRYCAGWNLKTATYQLKQPLYIYRLTTTLDLSERSWGNKDLCAIRCKDGIWYLRNCGYAGVRMNSAVVRGKCEGMPVNTLEFSVPHGMEVKLLPGDCFSVVKDQAYGYFRIDQL